MGLFIHLFVNSQNISTQQWDAVYSESLDLLKQFPAKLMRFEAEEITGQKRYRYTSQLIKAKDTREEQWLVCGDMASNKHAESFSLPRYLDSIDESKNTKDILWAEEDSLYYADSHGIDLFGSKSQGYPYHLAILAVGILVESRFPGDAYVIGDIEIEQVENMMNWCNAILKTQVEKPVCFDAQHLYTRLATLYPDGKHVIERFRTLSMESETNILTALLSLCSKEQVLNDVEARLGEYHSLAQLGAIRIIAQLVESMRDVKPLIEMVVRININAEDKKLEQFDLESLLTLLVRNMITIKKGKRDALTQLADNMHRMGDINHTMGSTMMSLMGFSPSYFDYYITSEELLDIFSSYAAEKHDVFKKIIAESEQWCHEQIKQYQAVLEENEASVLQKNKSATETCAIKPDEQDLFNLSGTEGSGSAAPFSIYEQFILDDIYGQRVKFNEPLNAAGEIGKSIQAQLKEYYKHFEFDTRAQDLNRLYQASALHSIVLKEQIWEQIDALTDLALLRSLVILASVTETSANFCDWRIYILEHPHLWEKLVDKSQ